MITRDLILTVNNNTASLNEPVTIYMYDRGIKLNITVQKHKYQTGYTTTENLLNDSPNINKASAIIKSPDGKIFKYPQVTADIKDNVVVLFISESWTDEADEIGKYYIQLQLYDDEGGRVSLPPFFITIADLIYPYSDAIYDRNIPAYVDKTEYGLAFVGQEIDTEDRSSINDGFYDKTEWLTGSVISKTLLNKLEQRLDEVYSGDGIRETKIEELGDLSTLNAINNLKTLFDSLKSEVEALKGESIPIEPFPIPDENEILLESIEIDQGIKEVIVSDDTFFIKALPYPYDATKCNVTWKCLNTEVAEIEETNGMECKIKRLSYGLAPIMCVSVDNPGISAVVDVIFKDTSIAMYDIAYTTFGHNDSELYINDKPVVCVETKKENDLVTYGYRTGFDGDIKRIKFGSNVVDILKLNEITNVKDLSLMFEGCTQLKTICNINVSSIENMSSMFKDCYNLEEIDLSNLETSKVEDMSSLFENCYKLKSFGTLNTYGAKNIRSMFKNCRALNSIPDLDVTNVIEINDLYSGCTNMEGHANAETYWTNPKFANSNESFNGVFRGCTNLYNFYEIPSSWGGGLVTAEICKIVDGDFDSETVDKIVDCRFTDVTAYIYPYEAFNPEIEKSDLLFSDNIIGATTINVDSGNDYYWALNLEVEADDFNTEEIVFVKSKGNPSASYNTCKIQFNEPDLDTYTVAFKTMNSGKKYQYIKLDSDSYVKAYTLMPKYEYYGYKKPDSREFVNISFSDSEDISEIKKLNISHLAGMNYIFKNCSNLSTIDTSDWNTENINSIINAFEGCINLTSLDLGGLNTKSLETAREAFKGCTNLVELDISDWTNEKLHTITGLLSGCSNLERLNISGFKTDNVDSADYVFENCQKIKSLDLSGWNTKTICNFKSIFSGCSSLETLDLAGWDVSNANDISYMFNGCSSLKTLDLSNWNTNNVNNMTGVFSNCSNLKSLNLSNWIINTIHYTDLFKGCYSLNTLDLSGWEKNKIAYNTPLFKDCHGLRSLTITDIELLKATYDSLHSVSLTEEGIIHVNFDLALLSDEIKETLTNRNWKLETSYVYVPKNVILDYTLSESEPEYPAEINKLYTNNIDSVEITEYDGAYAYKLLKWAPGTPGTQSFSINVVENYSFALKIEYDVRTNYRLGYLEIICNNDQYPRKVYEETNGVFIVHLSPGTYGLTFKLTYEDASGDETLEVFIKRISIIFGEDN